MRAAIVRKSALIAIIVAAGAGVAGQPGVVSAGGGACHQAPTREGSGTEVRMTRNCFSPSILRVEAGADVAFHNDDQVLHQISSIPGEQPGESNVVAGQVATRTFMDTGIYPYFCNLHVGMVGAIVVGDGKFVASSAGRAQPVAVQAAQSRDVPAVQPGAAAPAAAAADDEGSGNWPLYGGLAVAAAGIIAGATIATRSRR